MLEVQSLYDNVNDMLNDAEARQSFKTLTASNISSRTQYKDRLEKQLKFVEATIFPAIDQTTTTMAQLVKKYSD